ncbi:MAG: GIY-YIG nuclease family protein, partial [Kiritimatiellaeota bacterium]|nr:GIY-YIG nuclease family protein [Kiritimatiellota bacterium]
MPYYVLANPDDRIYIGQTQDLDRRLREHNDPADRTTFHTKRFPGPGGCCMLK